MNVDKQGRYSFTSKLLSTRNGELYIGKDLSLRREVLLYRLPEENSHLTQLSHVSGLTDPRFLHILDMGQDDRSVYAVLEHRQGDLLHDRLLKQPIPMMNALELIYKLGFGLQEALEEKIHGFSLAADNIWLSEEHELIIINYWSEGLSSQKGVKGLIHLLYELVTSSMVMAEGFDSLEHSFRTALKETPTETLDTIIHLLKQTYHEQYSLSSFLVDLGVLLKKQWPRERKQGDMIAHSPISLNVNPKQDPQENKEMTKPKTWEGINKNRGKRPILFLLLAVILFGGMFTIVRHVLNSPPSAKPAPAPVIDDKDSQQLTITQQPTPETNTTPPTTEEVIVPDLRGLSKEDAEKQALTIGLHYVFFIESNTQAAGTVFKQNLPAGKKVSKETTLTFWVSKGNG
ncbi:MAG TPA: PASTA domain-containing protein [Bacillota bacterium]|nr:PASTA domain-containing protein [Bacillota bacterium]